MMKSKIITIIFTNILFIFFLLPPEILSYQVKYPEVKRTENVIDDYFGSNISDPYRWLEDLNSEETKEFIDQQNNLTNSYIKNFPQRDEILGNLETLWNHTDNGPPLKAGHRYFFFSQQAGQNQSVYYYKDSYDGPAFTVLDPNSFSDETASLSAGSIVPSNDGQIIGYGISYGGIDWYKLHFKNISSGEVFPEVLTDIKLSNFIWTPDNEGVIYSRYDSDKSSTDNSVKKSQNIYYHKIGTNQSEDILIVEFPNSITFLMGYNNIQMTSDNKYLILTPYGSIPNNYVWYANIENALKNKFQSGKLQIESLETKGDASYKFLANIDSKLYFLTSKNASNLQIVSTDLNDIGNSTDNKINNWSIVVPEESNSLEVAAVVNKDVLVLNYIKDVKDTLELRNLENGTLIKHITLDNGFLSELNLVPRSFRNNEFYYKFQSFLTPGKIFRINFENPTLEPELISESIINGYNSSDYNLTQIFYSSKDGTKVPMYILHKRDYVPHGNSPCLLYAYGGFGINAFKSFEEAYISFLQLFDGIVALPSIRGGGEYGEKWHEAGRHHKKQNSFDDFAAAAEYLIREKYTEPSKITINGASNGGLLVAVSINQRPDLFGAAVAEVGVMDMIRFQILTDLTHVINEYGIATNEEDFRTLIKYSPLQNVKLPENETVQYPPTFLVTGDKDDRVPPYHSYKLIAELQHEIGRSKRQFYLPSPVLLNLKIEMRAQRKVNNISRFSRTGDRSNPLLLKVEHNTGHGHGKSTSLKINLWADIFSFVSKVQSLRLNVQNF